MNEVIYGADSDAIDSMIASACAPGGDRTVALGRIAAILNMYRLHDAERCN